MKEKTSPPQYLSSGYSVQKQEEKLYLINHHTSGLYVVGFVTGLITFICSMNMIIIPSVLYSEGEDFSIVLVILLCLSLVAGLSFFLIRKTVMKRHRLPIEDCDIIAIIDLEQQTLLEKNGDILAPLSSVSLKKRFQMSSSAPSFALSWPNGERIVVRGNAFAGGSDAVVRALHQHGIGKNG